MILEKIFHHSRRNFWILTSPICFKLSLREGIHKISIHEQYSFSQSKKLVILHQTILPFLALPYFCEHFLQSPLLGSFRVPIPPLTKRGTNYGIPGKTPTPLHLSVPSVHFLRVRDRKRRRASRGEEGGIHPLSSKIKVSLNRPFAPKMPYKGLN